MRKCEHKTVEAVWRNGHESLDYSGFVALRCMACGALGVRSLGPSNDEPEAVRVEIRAAEIAWCAGSAMSESEAMGYGSHPFHDVDHPAYRERAADSHEFAAGWLGSEIDAHRSEEIDGIDASAWPWDPTRPVAGQYERYAWAASAMRDVAEVAADPATEVDGGAASAVLDVPPVLPADGDLSSLPKLPVDFFDDEHHDADVDARFDVTDEELLPNGEAK